MADFKPPTAKLYANAAADKNHVISMRTDWSGLDRRAVIDTGVMTDMRNVSMSALPYLITAPKPVTVYSGYDNPISVQAFADFILIIYRDGTDLKIDYIRGGEKYTGVIKTDATPDDDNIQRNIVQFQVFTDIQDPLFGDYTSKLLLFPDKKSFDFDITGNFTLAGLDHPDYPIPNIIYPVIHQSRLFGVDTVRIFASGFNDYTFWDLDTAASISEAGNAWVSTSQSNYKARGNFTGITTYGGHVVCFKKDFIQQVYNNKNPFRVVDIDAAGAIDNRGIAELQGALYYVSADNVKYYTGGMPHNIADQLGIGNYEKGILGAYKDTLYMYESGSEIFTYNVTYRQWSIIYTDSPVINFAANSEGIYALHKDGTVKQYNTEIFSHDWYFMSDLIINNSFETQSIEKMDMYAELYNLDSKVDVYLLKANEEFTVGRSLHVLTSDGMSRGRGVLRTLVANGAYYGQRLYVRGHGLVRIFGLETRYKMESETYA